MAGRWAGNTRQVGNRLDGKAWRLQRGWWAVGGVGRGGLGSRVFNSGRGESTEPLEPRIPPSAVIITENPTVPPDPPPLCNEWGFGALEAHWVP